MGSLRVKDGLGFLMISECATGVAAGRTREHCSEDESCKSKEAFSDSIGYGRYAHFAVIPDDSAATPTAGLGHQHQQKALRSAGRILDAASPCTNKLSKKAI